MCLFWGGGGKSGKWGVRLACTLHCLQPRDSRNCLSRFWPVCASWPQPPPPWLSSMFLFQTSIAAKIHCKTLIATSHERQRISALYGLLPLPNHWNVKLLSQGIASDPLPPPQNCKRALSWGGTKRTCN